MFSIFTPSEWPLYEVTDLFIIELKVATVFRSVRETGAVLCKNVGIKWTCFLVHCLQCFGMGIFFSDHNIRGSRKSREVEE